ncbi:MAG: hypothetical protein QM734_17815 [Cyclobacteriaceae bacterium]
MKKLKNLILLFTSLVILFFSVGVVKPSSSITSIQSKNVVSQLTSFAADDIDDDFVGHEFQIAPKSHCRISSFAQK